jgi:hypothetical protein
MAKGSGKAGLLWAVALAAVTIAPSLADARPVLPATAPVPPPQPMDRQAGAPAAPELAPLPDPRPDIASPSAVPDQPAQAIPKPTVPRPVVSAEEMKACLADLAGLGVRFTVEEPVSDPAGCAIPNPVTLADLGKTVRLAPEALLDCPMALAAARFMRDIAAPEAKAALGSEVTSISHASAYVCRPRHGETKMSEHAFGDALDVASFGLADGRRIDVRAGAPASEAAFLDAVRKKACGPFKTVLGPGSDPDHALHFHFDLEPRRHGSTFCQ